MRFRVTYPLITTDGSQDFDTKEEADRFANEMRNRSSPYLSINSWRHVRVKEIPDAPRVG